MIDDLTAQDALRYEKLTKEATASPLVFRASARRSIAQYPRDLRRLIRSATEEDVPAYTLLSEWASDIAPTIDKMVSQESSRHLLRNALVRHLRTSNEAAEDRAQQLLSERFEEMTEDFIDKQWYDARGRGRPAASRLLQRPLVEIADIHERFLGATLYQAVAHDLGMAIYDPHAPALKRWYLALKERRQIKRYNKQQAKRLDFILARQHELKTDKQSIVGRIITLELDAVLVLDAYRQYKKRLDALKPASKTPAKTLSLFESATKPIRETYASKLTTLNKLADLQNALKEIDSVLVEMFDMTDTQRNELMTNLKEYRDLNREATRITNERDIAQNTETS